VVSVAAIIASGVNRDGRREILGLAIGPSEAPTFWVGFLRSLQKPGLKGDLTRYQSPPKGRGASAPGDWGSQPCT
jgi:transposase-like protein